MICHSTLDSTANANQTSRFGASFIKALLLIGLLVLAGCRGEDRSIPKTEYGKLIGKSSGTSLNGTGVFAELLRNRGHQVFRQDKISGRLELYETIVWMPDRSAPPSAEAVVWLEDWLAEDGRTLIYVGRGYQADIDYWNSIVAMTEGPEREAALRHRAEAESAGGQTIYSGFGFEEDVEGLWYDEEEKKIVPSAESIELSGPWSKDIDASKTTIDAMHLLMPPEALGEVDAHDEVEFSVWGFRSFDLESEVLLKVDDKPFAFRIESEDLDSQLIVVSNASFLLNFPMLSSESRRLAARVADECEGRIVFLETGPWSAGVSDGNAGPHNAWAWISNPPMSYIVPHLLLWGVLFCFAFFPIFGHPKRLNHSPEKKFNSHVAAVGELLKKTKNESWAKQKLAEYQRLLGRAKK